MDNVGLKVMCFSASVPAQDAKCTQPGYRHIKRYGHRSERNELIDAGASSFERPGMLDWRSGHRFKNAMLPPYMRRRSTIDGQVPALRLAGVFSEHRSEPVRSMQGARAEQRVRCSLIQAIL